jgi:hypothetical protein
VSPAGEDTKEESYTENRVSIATFKEDKIPLLDDEALKLDNNSVANLILSIGHEVDADRTYGIIILQDYIQSSFYYEHNLINDILKLEVEPNSVNDLSLSIKVHPDTVEIVVLIVRDPDDFVKELDFEKIFYYEQLYSKRYIVEGAELSNLDLKYDEPQYIYNNTGDLTPIFFSDNRKKKNLISSIKENKMAYLQMNSPFEDNEMTYAVIAFENWKQSNLNGKEILHINTPVNETYVYELKTSDVQEDTNLQFIAFPYPYEFWDDRYAFKVEQSIRTVVEPK